MPRVQVSDLQEYLDEDQGEQVPRYSRKEKKERKESLPPPPKFFEE